MVWLRKIYAVCLVLNKIQSIHMEVELYGLFNDNLIIYFIESSQSYFLVAFK